MQSQPADTRLVEVKMAGDGVVAKTPPAAAELSADPLPDADGWLQPDAVQLADGTQIRLHKDGAALHAAYEAIRHAQNRICLEVYIFQGDTTGRAFADLLAHKARQGVSVWLVYDSFGSWRTPGAIFEKMRRAGVHVRAFHPIIPWNNRFSWRPGNRDHRKLLIIDDDIAGMGGLNIGAEYAGSAIIHTETRESWRDNAIGVVGPGARLLLESFRRTWSYINHGGRIAQAQFIHGIESDEFGLLGTVPSLKCPLLPFLHGLFKNAKKYIHLTMAYFAPGDPLVHDLCEAARRGVRVRLMLPGTTDIRVLKIAAQSFYETLLNSGVHIFERRGAVLHAKTMAIDDEVTLIGSINLDYRSIEFNLELSAVIRNRQFCQQMYELFHNDMRHADRITLNKWRYRPMRDRIGQWAVSRARYLL